MNEQKIFFYRDESIESKDAKAILDEHKVQYEEVYSSSDRDLPCVFVSGSAVPFCGVDGVSLYISYFSET